VSWDSSTAASANSAQVEPAHSIFNEVGVSTVAPVHVTTVGDPVGLEHAAITPAVSRTDKA